MMMNHTSNATFILASVAVWNVQVAAADNVMGWCQAQRTNQNKAAILAFRCLAGTTTPGVRDSTIRYANG